MGPGLAAPHGPSPLGISRDGSSGVPRARTRPAGWCGEGAARRRRVWDDACTSSRPACVSGWRATRSTQCGRPSRAPAHMSRRGNAGGTGAGSYFRLLVLVVARGKGSGRCFRLVVLVCAWQPGLEPGVTVSRGIFLVLKLKVSSSRAPRLQPTLWFALCHWASST